jgi:hypothetical protein
MTIASSVLNLLGQTNIAGLQAGLTRRSPNEATGRSAPQSAWVIQCPQSSSASHLTAGAFGFLTFIQCASDYVEIKRFGANPTHVVGNLDCYSMATSGKFGIFDEHTGRSWPCMCEYSSRDIYPQASISDTKGIDLNSCIGRGLKPYSYIDR